MLLTGDPGRAGRPASVGAAGARRLGVESFLDARTSGSRIDVGLPPVLVEHLSNCHVLSLLVVGDVRGGRRSDGDLRVQY
jgi:hypothetical protein